MSKRPSMTGTFADRRTKKPDAAPPSAPAPAPSPAEDVPAEAPARTGAKKEERVQILVRIDPATRKKLKLIAVEQDVTIQELCEAAIRDIVKRNAR